MVIKIADATYKDHPTLGATVPKYTGSSAHWYCASSKVCGMVDPSDGWDFSSYANLDCGDRCSTYSSGSMTSMVGWVSCKHDTYTYTSGCANSDSKTKYNYCKITFPASLNLAPAVTPNSGIVALDIGDLSGITSNCTSSVYLSSLIVYKNDEYVMSSDQTYVTLDNTTRQIKFDTSVDIAKYEITIYARGATNTWETFTYQNVGTISVTVDPCAGTSFTDSNTPQTVSFQSGDASAAFEISFNAFTPSISGCAPSTYRVTTGSSTGLTVDSSARKVTVTDKNPVKEYSFTLDAQKSDGTYYTSAIAYKITVGCTTAVTISEPSTLTSKTAVFNIGTLLADAKFQFDAFTVQYPSCVI